jgi:hypothetical protein
MDILPGRGITVWMMLTCPELVAAMPRPYAPIHSIQNSEFKIQNSPSYPSTLTPSYPSTLTPSYPSTLTPSYPSTLTPSYPSTLTPSYPSTLTPSYPSTLTPSYPSTLTPSYPSTLTPSYPSTLTPPFPTAVSSAQSAPSDVHWSCVYRGDLPVTGMPAVRAAGAVSKAPIAG